MMPIAAASTAGNAIVVSRCADQLAKKIVRVERLGQS